MKRIAVAALGCPNEVGFAWAAQQRAQTAALLKNKGLDVVEIEAILENCECADCVASEIRNADVEAVVICVITWSEDNYVLQLLRSVNVPLVLHSFPHMETGSLCGTMQMTSVMRDIGFHDYKTVFAAAGSEESAQGVLAALDELGAEAGKAKNATFNIGAIGGRVLGMTEIAYDEFALFEKCGAIIIPVSEVELLDEVDAVSEDAVTAALPLVQGRGYKITSSRRRFVNHCATIWL